MSKITTRLGWKKIYSLFFCLPQPLIKSSTGTAERIFLYFIRRDMSGIFLCIIFTSWAFFVDIERVSRGCLMKIPTDSSHITAVDFIRGFVLYMMEKIDHKNLTCADIRLDIAKDKIDRRIKTAILVHWTWKFTDFSFISLFSCCSCCRLFFPIFRNILE